jgi:hypothetical protein
VAGTSGTADEIQAGIDGEGRVSWRSARHGQLAGADELAPLVARFLREDPHADRDRVRQPS